MYFRYGLTQAEAGSRFFILDDKGLITKARSNLKELEENFYSLTTFAEDDTSMEGMQLLEVHPFSRKICRKNFFFHEIFCFTGRQSCETQCFDWS